MANGYYLARNGFLNQRSSYGINSAKGLIMAAKQSGQEPQKDDDYGAGSIGEALIEELMDVKGPEMLTHIEENSALELEEDEDKQIDD